MLLPSLFGENLFDDFFADFARPARKQDNLSLPTMIMRTDVKETADALELSIELPGFKKDDVKAQLKDGCLIISASTQKNEEEKDARFIRRERFSGSCTRSFYVGDEVTQKDISARFEDGLLFISIAKKEPQPQVEENHFISIEG